MKNRGRFFKVGGQCWTGATKPTMLLTHGACLLAAFLATFAYSATAPYAKFEDGMLSKTRPAGWLGEVCQLQADGLGGHPEALSYPYDTCLWNGEIPRMGTHGQDWCKCRPD